MPANTSDTGAIVCDLTASEVDECSPFGIVDSRDLVGIQQDEVENLVAYAYPVSVVKFEAQLAFAIVSTNFGHD